MVGPACLRFRERTSRLCGAQHAVVVAVPIVDMVQMASYKIVGVAPVLNRFMLAAVLVQVAGIVGPAGVRGRAVVRIRRRYGHGMFVNVALVRVMKVSFVQVVGVAFVQYGGVTAAGSVLVGMIIVNMVLRIRLAHELVSSLSACRQANLRPPCRQYPYGMPRAGRNGRLGYPLMINITL